LQEPVALIGQVLLPVPLKGWQFDEDGQ